MGQAERDVTGAGRAAWAVRRRVGVWASAVVLTAVAVGVGWSGPAGAAGKATPGFLDAVSCVNSTYCVAVGSQGVNNSGGLSEIWDGTTWTEQPVADPAGGSNVQLFGVACTAQDVCLAVGSYSRGGGALALAEAWNGSSWTIETVPLPADDFDGGGYGNFDAVSCSSSASCMAVGDYPDAGNDNVALAEYWNGFAFTPEPVPAAGSSINTLDAVSCPTSGGDDCEALGWWLPAEGSEIASVLSVGWNGTAWSQQATPYPDTPGGETYPAGISCVSPTACTAVGFGFVGSSPENAWAMQFSNGGWTADTVPVPGGATYAGLDAVSCGTNATSCNAVGVSGVGALAEHRSGGSWSVATTTDPAGSSQQVLAGVSCEASSKPCEAVGYDTNAKGVQVPLVEVWKGSKWTVQAVPKL
jgi:hypothetical protein